MEYLKCKLRYIFTMNCSLVNCVLFPYNFFSKIVRAQRDTIIVGLLYH